ncbi:MULTISPECIES: TetR/AcrR family transcriptional regulator [Anoxybacillus]|uniref:TetR/AcrR family transcriptional regulator n=1 Tax=Anoxybacteroides rupiense TaxID=311460 RepID=A0ABD5IY85_9BACL|nr:MULTISPECIES: TetR/AcrR family transcriptional regulator [Anoxybacillus]MBS2771372.1 TetR/AcrR family transcriptional regulator [Anoxybacillus rupiensis]MDE8563908.1 TetR/AcrR family transcriptional regulator [Anoxybacillus rupiensis]MED5052321.1 TetR/AcrR family transcriptional regulator [Anoxybacillus rupiensis]OQM45437.1 TetR family transcriptional regulator [Anoxybacillus sp. UARK-01]QHC05935.1 TetR family transcriptional regulator [Anoxybacillus sp. PDR2]
MKKREVPASVKDERLVKKRRNEMIKGAISLFKQKGFHRTTTREIAKASGFSIGTLYEYIRQKEDVLYLVCDRIYDEVRERMEKDIDTHHGTIESFKLAIAHYFRVVNELQDEVLVMYQEAKSLTKDSLPYVLNKELQMVGMFENILQACVQNGVFELTEQEIQLFAHNIFVLGQMWAFRRWALHKMYTLEEYIELQTDLLLRGILEKRS